MSYEYTHTSGSKMVIRDSAGSADRLFVQIGRGHSKASMHILKADAPTVAAELLKAAGQESVIVAKSAAGVRGLSHGELECGGVITNADSEPEDLRATAAECVQLAASWIALAEYIESKASREAEAEKHLRKRRDALASELGGYEDAYDAYPTGGPMQKAIDYAIELEDKLAAK